MTMDKVKAWELLNDSTYCAELNMEEFHNLMLRAGYSEDVSHKAALKRGWNRISAGLVM